MEWIKHHIVNEENSIEECEELCRNVIGNEEDENKKTCGAFSVELNGCNLYAGTEYDHGNDKENATCYILDGGKKLIQRSFVFFFYKFC